MSLDRVRAELHALRHRPHAYLSTACRHELHEQCCDARGGPGECRWCGAKCLCRCHRRAPDERGGFHAHRPPSALSS